MKILYRIYELTDKEIIQRGTAASDYNDFSENTLVLGNTYIEDSPTMEEAVEKLKNETSTGEYIILPVYVKEIVR